MANYIDNTSLSQILTYLKKYIDDIANTKQNSLNRTIWGASDTGGDISGNMFVGDSKKVNNYLEYANGAINLQGNIFITGGNAATKDYVSANYLSLRGGTLTGTALFSFADSGNWSNSNSGVTFPVTRGGFHWSGQSDWVTLFAEETGSDNLNLVLQFGDDNSNGLSIRNTSGVQTAYISALGIFTGTLNGNADSATVASKLGQNGNSSAPMTFNWSGQSGQPSWLWGGNDGTNMYVYNPSNFNVAYANNSGALSGYTVNNIQESGWISLPRSGSNSSILWIKIGQFTTTVGDNLNNDACVEILVNGDQNYAFGASGTLIMESYGSTSRSIVLSSVGSSYNNANIYATIDSSFNIWLGFRAQYTGRTLIRPLFKGSYVNIFTSGFTSQTTNPNDTYISGNGSYKYGGSVSTNQAYGLNAASATKLQTTRTIWGQSFDGSGNVDGTLNIRNGNSGWAEGIRLHKSSGGWDTIILCGADNTGDTGTSPNSWSIHNTSDNNFAISRNSSDGANGLLINQSGNVGIGTTSPAYKLDVNGNGHFAGPVDVGGVLQLSNSGLKFADNAFGGGGDIAKMYLATKGGEATTMTFEVGNDGDDTINFITPSSTGLTHNSNIILDSLNYSSYITSSYISNLVSDTFEPRTIGNNVSTGGTAPYNYLYLCRIGNSVSYSTLRLLLRFASRYNQYTEFTIGISTGQYAYGSSIIDAERIFGNATLYYVRTQNASGYDYYDIYADAGAWNTINWDISKKGDNGVLEYTVENTKLDTLPAGAVQFTDWTSFSATKVNNTLSWSGYSSGSFNGSAAASISIPTKLSQLTNDIHANIDGVSYGTLKIYPSDQITVAGADDGAITPKGVNKYVSSYALPLHGNADSATVASKLNIPITTTSIDNSDNSLYACYAPGSNSVTTKPSGVDGFGLIGLRVAAGWYGQILMADGSDMFYRNGNGISSSTTWKRLLDSGNYSSFALPLHGTADSATVASRLGQSGNSSVPMTFNWSGQSGQPSWLWGGNDGTNMYVYNPLNFRVNYANSASDSNKLGGFTEASFLRERGNWADGANALAGLSVTSWYSKVNYQTDYGNSLHIQGNNTWYNRLDFGTNGRIYFYQAINPSTLTGCMQYKGALAYLTDTVAASTKVIASIPANSSDDLVYATIADNDYFRIHVGGASNGGWGEIATANEGTEPIYARQYTGAFANIARTLTLLDENGNTNIPGALNIGGSLTLPNNTGLLIKDSAGNAQRTLFISSSNAVYFGCNDTPSYTIFEGSQLQFNVYNSGWQSAMVLDSNKNMTVNGTAHINGTIYTDVGLRSRNICIETESDGTTGLKSGEINNFTNTLYLQYSSPKNLMCCNGGGNVSIGPISPTYKLDVYGNGRFTSDLTAQRFINSSDRNLKENILDLNSDYLNKVELVEFREFNFKDDKSKTKHYGVIAQDLQELGLDDLVQKDLKGNLGVDYISLLILEIKSLKDKLNELEKKLN